MGRGFFVDNTTRKHKHIIYKHDGCKSKLVIIVCIIRKGVSLLRRKNRVHPESNLSLDSYVNRGMIKRKKESENEESDYIRKGKYRTPS